MNIQTIIDEADLLVPNEVRAAVHSIFYFSYLFSISYFLLVSALM